MSDPQIHSSSVIHGNPKIGKNVRIGAFCEIFENVEIGDNSVIDSHCVIGYPTPLAEGRKLVIGEGALIRTHSIFYEGSTFGPRLRTGHNVTVRELTVAGENLQIGTLSDIQGHCEFGNFVRMHSNVHVGQKSKIGHFVWIFPYVVLTNDPHPPSEVLMGVTIEDYAVIATMTTVLPGVRIASHSLVGAHSLVVKNVAENIVVGGSPAKEICPTSAVKHKHNREQNVYPWPRYFQRGYPEHVVSQWKAKFHLESTK